ncbi:hypothetical protein SPOG_05694 [Schizosaccharomyces cryophilus OY26]|uniref:Uncharacterized protein n=1 Tax=Schizosaccharomyces cryophilus (strain OY26 / ATCC MYA-4695 / CBS 11777 / NBRC 106824 / NRRL Y48691) TaxID=653667 RepID=S9W597_SCHCR|nr:uncharacterized protein SPOG_05694 [Schizosaccharomyces cryophilus OY26]EPY53100.1 hypothetical protein SPOG_05694 [Schizosaccharomyces cryophilus OY26]
MLNDLTTRVTAFFIKRYKVDSFLLSTLLRCLRANFFQDGCFALLLEISCQLSNDLPNLYTSIFYYNPSRV